MKKNVTLDSKKYYQSTVKMAKLTDLSTISSNYEAKDGEILTGTLGSNVKISIADGAKVTLKDVDINGSGTWTSGDYAGITCEGDATITLEGTNTVKGFADGYPGIFVSSGKTLVINGTGELNASSNGSYDNGSGGAGIGGGNKMNCGNIEIQSGTVTATGNANGAGIGGGQDANCGNITISGGTVTATGGDRAAGIGGGRRGPSGTNNEYDTGSCGNITISGGTITATGGENAAGIGGGRGNNNVMKSSCGTIEITSGVTSVTATGGADAAGIGAGKYGICGAVTIEAGANVTQMVPATAHQLSASVVGDVVDTNGDAYTLDATHILPSGVTAMAMVAYKSTIAGKKSLAIQLNSSPVSKNWDDAKTYAEGLTAVYGGTWRLPSKEDWQDMIVGCAVSGDATALNGSNALDPIKGFKAKIAATGITWQSTGYWSSTESHGRAWGVAVRLDQNYAFFMDRISTSEEYAVLGCLAF